MTRTTITLDDELLRIVAEELGTVGKSDTVNAALAQIAAARRRRDALAGFDLISDSLAQPDALDGAWR